MTNDKLSHARHSSDPDLMDSSSRPPSSPYSQTKPRRPLPVPGEQQPKAIPATYFYNNEAKSSASKPTQIGSTHTSYIAPSSPLPTYRDSTYREPEPIMDDDPVPPLIPATESGWGDTNNTGWENTPSFQWDSTNWASGTGWNTGSSKVIIDGRSDEEEENWCDPELREKCKRPGPGMLPPCLADMLHNPDHTLYSVQATPPVLRQGSTAGPSTPASSTLNFLPPTPEEVRMAIPHPNAYYCKEHNGWVLLNWRSSSILPPLAQSFTPSLPLPDQVRRKKLNSCIGDGEQQSGQTNKTHHFHRYQRAVDARMLTTAYKRTDWEDEERLKSRRRKMTLSIDLDADQGAGETNARGERDDEEPEGELLDLYVCCQCSVYCLASKVIPGVLSQKFVDEFTKDKLSHPALDKTPKTTVLAGWETVLTIIENRLWKAETRVLPVTRPKFQSKLGWNQVVRSIFETLGFTVQPSSIGGVPGEQALHPAQIDLSTPEGKRTRAKLLRAWVEVSAWLAIFQKINPKSTFGEYNPQTLSVTVESAREMYQTGIGAHVNQIPRGQLPAALVGNEHLDKSWEALGMTPSSYSPDLLLFAYFAQCRCDPAHTIEYFTHLATIFDLMGLLGVAPPDDLQTIIAEERSRGRFTAVDTVGAATALGFGKDSELRVELDSDVDDQFILDAWKNGLKRAWREPEGGSSRRKELNDAFKVIADARGSPRLRKAWKEERGSGMSPDTAYATLEVPRDVDETMILAIYGLRVSDQPSQQEKMREALSVIAEFTDSSRLRQFLETGQDPGDLTFTTTQDMPRGLNQLGNTCYLNSLLQYFYTIKDLRVAVAPLANADAKSLDDSKLTDDDLKRHRVGGRLVTRREIFRSKKFVNQLADLFWNMEFCDVPAVTPTIDLAKLALVTSQDEEEEDQEKTGTDASNDTDATLVEDAPPRTYERSSQSPVQSPTFSSPGKRNRLHKQSSQMDIDSILDADKEKEGYVLVSKPSSPRASGSPAPPEASGSNSKQKTVDQDGDIEMRDVSTTKPPPLPPRKPRDVDDSVMMFGRQHDVSECMDNCMFQIETALLDFQGLENPETDKTSVVKRLFYGKKKQRLTPLTLPDPRRQPTMHEKEDLFSHLHVNVSEEGYDLYDGLSRYFDDVVEFEGVKKRMDVSLIDLPPLLQIQLQRVQFDRETQQAYKSQAYVKFGETIYLDRFMDSADPAKRARSKAIQAQLDASRDQIQRLTAGKHAPFDTALGGVADFLAEQDLFELSEEDEVIVTTLRSERDYVTSQLETERANVIKLKAELEDLWKGDTEAAYELTSVFVHRGSSPSWGHYFFYSRHLPHNPDSWFKYNDSDVSVVPKEEVLGDTTGSNANPYMLVFSKKGSDVIHTVHRFDPENLQDG